MSIVDWIFPKYCVGCGEEGNYVCEECRKGIQRVDGSLRYSGVVRKMLKEIKYRGTYDMVKELVDIWEPEYHEIYVGVVVASVPMWESKEKERGYNQAELIARVIARKWRLPYRSLLCRTRQTRPMYGLGREERKQNVEGAFEALDTIPNKIILVDDVFTTGATLRECERVLIGAGARNIYKLTVAR